MLKRLLVATAVAASTLVISGPITTQAASAAGTLCTTVEQRAVPAPAAVKCRWKERYGKWCKFCYKYGGWRLSYCKSL
ncbi:hypothetical protein [Nonomuraea turcica]|uniref:hypothetical protein n=1 Tax=Nonomuraea sp. G32 TaxID=3067274 RepID=UPI00273B6EDC|nr:hypothetical protein [Nonomuraea sp. G32]MDP4503547.1 hypothetical protein [Nonomuraea sp. G32]